MFVEPGFGKPPFAFDEIAVEVRLSQRSAGALLGQWSIMLNGRKPLFLSGKPIFEGK